MAAEVPYHLVCIFCIVFAFGARADVKLSAIFGDNMVLQQQSQVSVWGWAKPNANVSITGSWNNKKYNVQSDTNGYWRAKITTPEAGFTSYTLTVSDGKALTLENILIGEVWVCSGQSNMEMPMRGKFKEPVEGGPEAILNSSNPNIRCFTLKRASETTPQDNCAGTWELASPQTTPKFTATGYFFARMINQLLNVPVGLIHTSWGGSRIEAWMPADALKDIPEKPIPPSGSNIGNLAGTPTVLYNGMIHPIVGYGIRGALWYQGESNCDDEPALYVKMFDAMVREWRNLWKVGDFPFYYCQITPFKWSASRNSAYMREAQAKCMAITPNTGMAVLMDADSKNQHSAKKREAGERLAFWALAKTYGIDELPYRSPELKTIEIEGRMVTLTFDLSNEPGLTSYGKEILNFRVAGKNKQFYPAKVDYWGNKVYLFSPHVSEPVAVRYCFEDNLVTELFSIQGNLPVSSFRTDDWDDPSFIGVPY